MKYFFILVLINIIVLATFAQAPQKFSYQSVIRNSGNQLVMNQQVGIKISILQGIANGAAVYAETHSPLTNANGLATIEIGGGSVLSGNFANINWASGPYFVKTETDLNGGSNYTITSTTQLLSVPYALYSNTVSSSVSSSGDTLFIGNQSYIIPGISAANTSSGSNFLNIETALIPAGTFTMGSPTTEPQRESDEIQHQVTLSEFRMSKYEITNVLYAAFLNAKSIGSNGTLAVNSYSPNAYGLYNMHGNVWEWCADWYGVYATTLQTNPTGPSTGTLRLIRGGSFGSLAQVCRSANRTFANPFFNDIFYGFRLAFAP